MWMTFWVRLDAIIPSSMNVGDLAPQFDTFTDNGRRFSLERVRGRWVVLFFYPRDESYASEVQARRFEELLDEFVRFGAVIVGVSTDTRDAHAAFRAKCKLSYPLVSDRSKAISATYRTMNGLARLYGIANRHTFLIDPQGRIVKIWRYVNPVNHADVVRKELEARVVEQDLASIQAKRTQTGLSTLY